MKYGPWLCTCLDMVKGCHQCVQGIVRCERPDCQFEAVEERHGQRLCGLCIKDMKAKGVITVG